MCLPCASQVTPLHLVPDPWNLIRAPVSTFTDFREAAQAHGLSGMQISSSGSDGKTQRIAEGKTFCW